MEIYIINLPEQTKRREYMIELMKKMGVQQYNLVTPKNVANVDKIKKTQQSLLLTNIELFKSILAKERPPQYILVFEDDIKPMISADKIIPKLESLLEQMPNEWDMLYLEYCHETCFLNKRITPEISKASGPLCTAAILYNVEKLGKIVNLLEETVNQEIPIDNSYVKYILKNKLDAYIVTPPIFVQDVARFQTTINPYYIVRSIYGYHSCNTYMIVHTVIFFLVLLLILLLILKI